VDLVLGNESHKVVCYLHGLPLVSLPLDFVHNLLSDGVLVEMVRRSITLVAEEVEGDLLGGHL